jgi:hypothetical protein
MRFLIATKDANSPAGNGCGSIHSDIDAFRRYVGGEKHKAYVENHARHVTAKLAAIQHEM